jgi:hypothetical protein
VSFSSFGHWLIGFRGEGFCKSVTDAIRWQKLSRNQCRFFPSVRQGNNSAKFGCKQLIIMVSPERLCVHKNNICHMWRDSTCFYHQIGHAFVHNCKINISPGLPWTRPSLSECNRVNRDSTIYSNLWAFLLLAIGSLVSEEKVFAKVWRTQFDGKNSAVHFTKTRKSTEFNLNDYWINPWSPLY